MSIILIAIFLVGICLIALEDKIHVNKAATALAVSVVMWVIVSLFGGLNDVHELFMTQLSSTSETIFFIMGALAMVELTDTHGGFRALTNIIRTTNKRKLLWILSFCTFILSAILDNIATAVIIISILRKMVDSKEDRWIFASMIVIAANAGGAFSPIGDVTTILLWTGGNLTPAHQVTSVLLPSLTCLIIPLILVSRFFKKGDCLEVRSQIRVENEQLPEVSKKSRLMLLVVTVITMATVPLFNEIAQLPPFAHIIFGLALLWVYTDLMYNRRGKQQAQGQNVGENQVSLSVADILKRLDISTIFFFLGVLMSVGAMNASGVLAEMGKQLESSISEPLGISFVIGVMSSLVDNVALVAATQGMYPVAESGIYAVSSDFWTFLAYCAVTGGSTLIIGSATGVTVMGMEKVTFGYYLKRFSLIAFCGYIAGAAVFLLLN